MEDLPEGAAVKSVARDSASALTVVLAVTRPEGAPETELSGTDCTVTLFEEALIREEGAAAEEAAVAASALLTAAPVAGSSVCTAQAASLTQTAYWVDNNDEAGTRDAAKKALSDHAQILFSRDGGAWEPLTEENCEAFGLTKVPEIQITHDVTHSYLAADLPAEEGVSWKFGMDPDAAAGYEFFDVTEENIEDYHLLGGDPAKCGWYFVLTTDFTITVEMRDGDKSSNTELFAEAVNSQFRLQGHAATGVTDVPFGEVDWKKPEITSGISSAEMTCTVRKFNLDGSRITYKIVEYSEDGENNGILEVQDPDSMEEGDYYKIIFDNTGVPNFGAITTEVYDGGKILLTLAGQTDFTATKEWLEPEGTARPEATFELWRYRAGRGRSATIRRIT